MTSRIPANWEEFRRQIEEIAATAFPFETCSVGDLIGHGAAMMVFKGKYFSRYVCLPNTE